MTGSRRRSSAAPHHVGMSVADLDAALRFWEGFSASRRAGATRARQALSRHASSAIPASSIKAAFVDLPGGVVLELLDYQVAGQAPNPDATANPGNVHLCLAVDDCGAAWQHAVDAARGRSSPEGPVDVDGGPNIGARAAYLRIHDGITLELFQPAPARPKRRCMIKRISFVRRKAGMSQRGVPRPLDGPACRHRARHPRPPRPALRRGDRAGHPEEAAWDGVGEIWFDSVEAAEAAFRAEPHISRLIADRAHFLGEAQWCFVEEHTARRRRRTAR